MDDPTINPGAVSAQVQAQAEAQRASTAGGPRKNTAAQAAAQEFEAFFLAQVLDQMFAGIRSDGAFGGGTSERIYRQMLNAEYAKALSRSGGIGIADSVYREILNLQEVDK